MVLPTLLQVFGPSCYSKVKQPFDWFAFYAHFSKAREFVRFAGIVRLHAGCAIVPV
jgi:hypothetical protein